MLRASQLRQRALRFSFTSTRQARSDRTNKIAAELRDEAVQQIVGVYFYCCATKFMSALAAETVV